MEKEKSFSLETRSPVQRKPNAKTNYCLFFIDEFFCVCSGNAKHEKQRRTNSVWGKKEKAGRGRSAGSWKTPEIADQKGSQKNETVTQKSKENQRVKKGVYFIQNFQEKLTSCWITLAVFFRFFLKGIENQQIQKFGCKNYYYISLRPIIFEKIF